MKQTFVAILALLAITCTDTYGEPMYTLSEGGVVSPNEIWLDDDSHNEDFQDSSYDPQLEAKVSLNASANAKVYNVKLATFACWFNDSGYNVIEVGEVGKKPIYVKLQEEEIITYNDPMTTYGHSFREFSTSDMFVEADLNESSKALIFIGYPYDDKPAQLVILLITEGDVELICNSHMTINSIVREEGEFKMELQDVSEDRYTIWVEGGVLHCDKQVIE